MAAKISVITTIVLGLMALAIWTGETGVLALVGAILLLFVAGFVANIITAKKISVSLKVSEGHEEQEYIDVRILLKNTGILPVFKGKIRVVVENLNFHFKEKETLFFSLSGKSETELSILVKSDYCGKYRIMMKDIRCIDIWGITSFQVAGNLEESACLFPKWTNVGSVSEALRANYEKERKFAGRKGHILSDVLQYREYQKGDSLKHVNWKLTAKCGQWIVREFDTPVDNQILVISDITHGEPSYRNLAYNVLFSIGMSYLGSNIAYQMGYVENEKAKVVEINSVEDLFQAMRDILSEDTEEDKQTLDLISATENLYKYAKVIYVTNSSSPKKNMDLRITRNVHCICVDEKNYELVDYKSELKKLAV